MSTDPTALAREVLDAVHEDETITVCSIPDNKVATLARAVIAVSELHRPIRVYDECADPECPNEHIELYDYYGCEATALGWACPICCYDDEHPLECCEHGGDHANVSEVRACATRAALNGDHA